MRSAHVMIGVLAWWATSGCSIEPEPECLDECLHPPAAACIGIDTLREFDAVGTCVQDVGCVYGHTDRACAHGCSGGRCSDPDPCEGVVCDTPPDSLCIDASTLRVFDAVGVCVQPDGSCDYGFADRTCENGCEDGQCIDQEPCEGVVCDDPPPARCVDDTTIEEFDPAGICDPATGRCDYDRSERACPDGCLEDACLAIGDGRALLIPAGTRVCSDKRSTWDVFGGYQTRMRITFRDGVVTLPRSAPSFQRDWIASIEIGPDRALLEPLAAGTFTLTSSASRIEYQFVQEFSDGAQTYTLTYDVWFDPAAPEDRVRVFDELYLSPPITYPVITIELIVDGAEFERWGFLTCTHDLYLPVLHRVRTADGAALELEERSYPSEECMMACPTAFVRANFDLGDDHRQVTDPFRLAFVDSQHNWFEQFLVAFDDPVSDIHALYYFPNDHDDPERKVKYLDAGLDLIRSSLVESHTIVELWQTFDSDAVPVTTCAEYCRDFVGLAEGCEASCIVEGQMLSGRCYPSLQWPPGDNWTDLGGCEVTFEACAAAGRPYIQCCCSRIAGDW